MLSSFSLPPSFLSTPKAYLFLFLFVAHELSVPFVCYHHHSLDLALGVTMEISSCSLLFKESTRNSIASSAQRWHESSQTGDDNKLTEVRSF